jgi:hypothetical protein
MDFEVFIGGLVGFKGDDVYGRVKFIGEAVGLYVIYVSDG